MRRYGGIQSKPPRVGTQGALRVPLLTRAQSKSHRFATHAS